MRQARRKGTEEGCWTVELDSEQCQPVPGSVRQRRQALDPCEAVCRPGTRRYFGHPVVIPKGSVFVTEGTDRRTSGTHYTPTSLTEPIVRYTLEPLVFIGPAEGKPGADGSCGRPKN